MAKIPPIKHPAPKSLIARELASVANLYISRNAPFSLVHFITNRCNARCAHCFIDFDNGDSSKHELSLDEIRRLTKHLGNHLFNVNLTGGEPFLRKDIFEIVEAYFKNAGVVSVFITTNGTFTDLTREFIDKFIRSKIKGNIIFSISLDDLEEFHDKNRKVSGLFTSALRTFNMIKEYGLPNITAGIGITIAEHNYSRIIELYNYIRKLGVDNVTATPLREEGKIKKIDPEKKEGIYRAYCEVSKLIYRDNMGNGRGRINPEARLIDAKNSVFNEIVMDTYLKPRFISQCPAGSLFVVISADGHVHPCEILDSPIGSLRDYDMDLKKLLNTDRAKEVRRSIRSTKCNCVYGCAWTVNILSHLRYLPRLAYNCMRRGL